MEYICLSDLIRLHRHHCSQLRWRYKVVHSDNGALRSLVPANPEDSSDVSCRALFPYSRRTPTAPIHPTEQQLVRSSDRLLDARTVPREEQFCSRFRACRRMHPFGDSHTAVLNSPSPRSSVPNRRTEKRARMILIRTLLVLRTPLLPRPWRRHRELLATVNAPESRPRNVRVVRGEFLSNVLLDPLELFLDHRPCLSFFWEGRLMARKGEERLERSCDGKPFRVVGEDGGRRFAEFRVAFNVNDLNKINDADNNAFNHNNDDGFCLPPGIVCGGDIYQAIRISSLIGMEVGVVEERPVLLHRPAGFHRG